MRGTARIALALAAAACVAATDSSGSYVSVTRGDDRIDVRVDGALFTALHTAKAPRKLFLHPLMTPSGRNVTRSFPMEHVSGESTDHPHQRGVWIGSEDVSGMDFWENEPSDNRPNAGTVLLTDVTNLRSGAGDGRFTIHANWISAAGEHVISETRTMVFRAPSGDARSVDIDLALEAKKAITFADNHDAILGLRLGTAFEEAHGGKAVNAEGVTGWERLRGKRSAWVDWHATLDGENVGVAVMDSPANFRFPTPWHVRDYALLFASPFAFRNYNPEAIDGSLTLKPGERLTLGYRILVHSGAYDVARAFQEFAKR